MPNIFSYLFAKSFIVLSFIFKSKVHFELVLYTVWDLSLYMSFYSPLFTINILNIFSVEPHLTVLLFLAAAFNFNL